MLVFADTFYWTALLNPQDSFHQQARAYDRTNFSVSIVTTDEILTEVLNFFSKYPPYYKEGAAQFVEGIMGHDRVEVLAQSHESFMAGFQLYQDRLDKGYSLTDCISMITMTKLSISQVLTHDKHFTQEGFVIVF